MDRNIALDILSTVSIASPCEVSWDAMKGDNRVRFCGECHLNVYNLSDMKAVEAAELVQRSEGHLCIKFYQRSDGTMLTADCPQGLRPKFRWAADRVAAAITAAFGLVLGTSGCTMGGICPPVETGGKDRKPGKMSVIMGEAPTIKKPANNDHDDGQLKITR